MSASLSIVQRMAQMLTNIMTFRQTVTDRRVILAEMKGMTYQIKYWVVEEWGMRISRILYSTYVWGLTRIRKRTRHAQIQ